MISIYAPPPKTLVEKLADKLAGDDGYVVVTVGTRNCYMALAEDILEFIERESGLSNEDL